MTATSSVPSTNLERHVRRQRALLSVLGCPRCGRGVTPRAGQERRGLWVTGELVCPRHRVVGVIEECRPSLQPRDVDRYGERPRSAAPLRVALTLDSPTLTFNGPWEVVPEGRRSEAAGGDVLSFEFEGVGVALTFFAHDWSGRVEVLVDGVVRTALDLYRPTADLVEERIDGLPAGHHEVVVRPTGKQAKVSAAAQVIVNRIDTLVPFDPVALSDLGPRNRGNGYPPRFAQLVSALPPEAIVVDCGGGDRRFGDDRVFNMEYLHFELPDVLGDGLHLPFATDALDLVLSQAVLEHVPDQRRAVEEIARVLKPGGRAYFEVAFMQPLHAVPSHYFNVTPFGLRLLCDGLLDIDEEGTFTGLRDTVDWMMRLVNATERIGRDRVDRVLTDLQDLDEQVPPAELGAVAGSVYALATKPRGGPVRRSLRGIRRMPSAWRMRKEPGT